MSQQQQLSVAVALRVQFAVNLLQFPLVLVLVRQAALQLLVARHVGGQTQTREEV